MPSVTFKREELYQDVWSEPMVKLSQKYQISDTGLAKICRRMDVPIPYRGYWAKKQAGKTVGKQPLPQVKSNTLLQYSHEMQVSVPPAMSPSLAKQ